MTKKTNLLSLLAGVAIAAMSTVAMAQEGGGGNGSNGGDGTGGNGGEGPGTPAPESRPIYGGTCKETIAAIDAIRANPSAFTNGWEGAQKIAAFFNITPDQMVEWGVAPAQTGFSYGGYQERAEKLAMVKYYVDTYFTDPNVWNHFNYGVYPGFGTGYDGQRYALSFGVFPYDTDGPYISPNLERGTEPGRPQPNGCVPGGGSTYISENVFKPQTGQRYGQNGFTATSRNGYAPLAGMGGRGSEALPGDSTSDRLR